MYSDIKIYMQGYYWNQALINENFKNVNFMNWKSSAYSAWTPEFEVTNYIIKDSLSPLTYDFEDVNDSLSHFFTASDMSFELSDLPDLISSTVNGIPVTRFRQFLTLVPGTYGTGDTSYVKYIVRIKYLNSVVYQGVVNQDMIEETISTSDDTNKIKIQCFGFEKEVKEYYQSKKLTDYPFISDESFWNKAYYGVDTLTSYFNPRYMALEDFLRYIFEIIPSTGYRQFVDISDLEPTISNSKVRWLIFKDRHLTKQSTTRTVWFKIGVDNIVSNEESAWGFLTRLCNAMGWVFYVRHESAGNVINAYLTIKNRYSINKTASNTITIDEDNKLTPQRLAKTENRDKAWSVYIPNGAMDFGSDFTDELKYLRGYYVSNTDYYVQHTDPFKAVGVGAWEFNNKVIVNSYEDDNNLTIRYITFDGGGDSEIAYKKSDIMVLDAGWFNTYWRTDLSNLKNYEDDDSALGQKDIQYTGNYGSCLGFTHGNSGSPYWANYLYTHDEYCSDEFALTTFRKNMKMLLWGRSNIATDVSINEIETNPTKCVYLNDEYYRINNSGQYFVIREMKIDFINNITMFKLVKEL